MKNIDFIKLKKILPVLDKRKKEDIIKSLYLDVETTLNKMNTLLEIPKENILEDLHKSLVDPQAVKDIMANAVTLESLKELKYYDKINKFRRIYNIIIYMVQIPRMDLNF